PLRGDTHGGCGGRVGETDWSQGQYRAPVRPNPILLAYSVPSGCGGSLVGAAAAVLAFPVAGGVWDVDAAEAVAEGA
ncbi:hypothetical protein ACFY0G_45085, partial [Streptomyces sp. NPDC001552]|uniref:hypothetical protein n=1 Tax=Streptomyces sp. NPDC001552 TaxID=3364587 RepID=UPI0036A331D6